jgi:hypothetical protein
MAPEGQDPAALLERLQLIERMVEVWFFAETALVCEVGFGAWLMARERREGARA